MYVGCWLCGTVNDCNCPSEEEYERRRQERERQEHQKQHEASIRRQRAKIKKAPWYQPPNSSED